MAKSFNLTAEINLRGPSNLKAVTSKIRREIGAIKADVKLNVDPRAAKTLDIIKTKFDAVNASIVGTKQNIDGLNSALRSLSSSFSPVVSSTTKTASSLSNISKQATLSSKSLKTASNEMSEFGKQSALAVRRFAAFSVVTTGIYALINAVSSGTKSFIAFDRELIRLQQVTGTGTIGIKALSDEITNLATTLGVSSESLTQVAVTLAQAGLSANQTTQALRALAKTELAPSFDNITETTEGAIAAMRQFNISTQDLESALGSINAVAAAFAVESSDIITAIQRAGGAFAASSKGVSEGKDALNEFIAVFTSVRATTRESAETIATGLRTIFTRIQRGSTIDFLKQFGVELTDLDGKFVGPFEAVKRLSEVLKALDPRDLRFAQIVEELGGFRQIGKVIPLIQQFGEAQKALGVAQRGQSSLSEAQIKAQQSLANQLARVREEFLALIKAVGQSATFQALFKIVLGLTSGLIKLAGAFKPILPFLAVFGAFKGAKALINFGGGFLGGLRKSTTTQTSSPDTTSVIAREKERADATSKASEAIKGNTQALQALTSAVNANTAAISGKSVLNKGGKVTAFARGGIVPGSGNRDTVPAMLQPGEFVIRKKAVQALGTDQLYRMNQYKYGGKVSDLQEIYPSIGNAFGYDDVLNDKINDESKFVKIDPKQLSKKDIQWWKQSKKKSWEKFENLLEKSFGTGPSASGNGSKWALLDFPYTRSEAKFMPKGSVYDDPDSLKGNNEKTIAAKNYLFEQSIMKNKGNKPNLRVEELEKIQSLPPATVYWGDPQEFAAQGLNKGGFVQKFIDGGVVTEEDAAKASRATILEVLKKRPDGISSTAKKVGINASELYSILGKRNPDEATRVIQEAIRHEYMITANRQAGAARGTLTRAANQGLEFAAVGMFGDAFPTDIYDAQGSKGTRKVKLISSVMQPDLASQLDSMFTQGADLLSARAASSVMQSRIVSELKKGRMLNLDFDRTLVSGADNILSNPGAPLFSEFSDRDKVSEALSKATFTDLGQALVDIVKLEPELLSRMSIITARPKSTLDIIQKWLTSKGLPISKFQGFGGPGLTASEIADLKAAALEPGSLFVDDDPRNIAAAMKRSSEGIESYQYGANLPTENINTDSNIQGGLFEKMIKNLGGPSSKKGFGFDFPNGLQGAAKYFDIPENIPTDAKRTISGASTIKDNVTTYLKVMGFSQGGSVKYVGTSLLKPSNIETFAAGGGISGQDTVPALLTPGEFVINKKAAKTIGYSQLNRMNKADKIQGYNRGGPVGYIQRFAAGGGTDPRVIAAFVDAAERAGQSLREFEKNVKNETMTKALDLVQQRKGMAADIKTDITRTAATGLGDRAARKEFANRLQERIASLNPSAKSTDINKAIGEIFKGIKSGKTFDEILQSTSSSLKPFKDALDVSTDDAKALSDIQQELISEFGGLTEGIQVTIEQLRGFEYLKSGKAGKEFGMAGQLNPQMALAFKQSRVGSGLLGAASKFKNLGIDKLDGILGKLPGKLGEAANAIGGIPGIISAGASLLGETLPGLAKTIGLADNTIAAGLSGMFAEGGSMALSLGALGTNLAGPIGGMIGTIGGAISGAILGFFRGSKTKQLENSFTNLNASIEKANQALETLSAVDNEKNYIAAAKAVDSLRFNINDLGMQAQTTLDERGTAAAGYGLAGATTGLLVSAAVTSALVASGIMTGGISLLVAGGLAGLVGGGIYGGTTGFADLDKEALEGQLKSIDEYTKGLNTLATRRIKLESLETMSKRMKEFDQATTDIDKERLGAKSSRIQEAQRMALINAGYQNEDIDIMLRGGGRTADIDRILNQSREEAAFAIGAEEIKRLYAGNDDRIKKELSQREKVIAQGKRIAAAEDNRLRKELQLEAVTRATALQMEILAEKFNKISARVSRFNYELERSQQTFNNTIDLLTGAGQVTNVDRTNEEILKNTRARTLQEVQSVLPQVGALAGGGSLGKQITDSITGRKVIEDQLPGILANATQNNIKDVVDQIENLFRSVNIDQPTTDTLTDQLEEFLKQEVSGRAGKSFEELLNDFPALQEALKGTELANRVGSELLNLFNNSIQAVVDNLNRMNQVIEQITQSQIKFREKQLELSNTIDEIMGRPSFIGQRTDQIEIAQRTANVGSIGPRGTLNYITIRDEFRKLTDEIVKIDEQRSKTTDPKKAAELATKQAKLTRESNNLIIALEKLRDATGRVNDIMARFKINEEVANNARGTLRDILTKGPEELLTLSQDLQAFTSFIGGAGDYQNLEQRQRAFRGADVVLPLIPEMFRGNLQNRILSETLQGMGLGDELKNMIIAAQLQADPTADQDTLETMSIEELLNNANQMQTKAELEKVKAQQEIVNNMLKDIYEKDILPKFIEQNDKIITSLKQNTDAIAANTVALRIRQSTTTQNGTNTTGSPQAQQITLGNPSTYGIPQDSTLMPLLRNIEAQAIRDAENARKEALASPDKSIREANQIYNDIIRESERKIQELVQKYNNVSSQNNTNPQNTPPAPVPIVLDDSSRRVIENFGFGDSAISSINLFNTSIVSFEGSVTIFGRYIIGPDGFSESVRSFGSHISKLKESFPKIPNKIDMIGNHRVDVNINGADILTDLDVKLGDLITKKIDERFSREWNRTGGEVGSRTRGRTI